MKVLVTDAHYKHSLAAVRSLGKEGVEVITASHMKYSISFCSKYSKKHYIYSNPSNETKFLNDLFNIISGEHCDVLLPISYTICTIISKNKELIEKYTNVSIVNYESMQIASDKNKTIQFAKEHGIPVPNTFYPKNVEDIESIRTNLNYPVVIKAAEESGSVKYANTEEELIDLYNHVCCVHSTQIEKGKVPQIQEYIPGEGYGFFALYNNGIPKAVFAHQRIHEYPPTGGPSTMAKSISDPELINIGLKLLNSLNWHGVAMVEFKKDERDNVYKLIEINPKFWGSLDLSIHAGINFPYLLCKMCIDGDIEPVFNYKQIIFRWIGPDFIYAIANNSLKEFISHFFSKNIHDDLDFYDIVPTTIGILLIIIELKNRLKTRKLKNIHGVPKYNEI